MEESKYYFFKITTRDEGVITGVAHCRETELENELALVTEKAGIVALSYEATEVKDTMYVVIKN